MVRVHPPTQTIKAAGVREREVVYLRLKNGENGSVLQRSDGRPKGFHASVTAGSSPVGHRMLSIAGVAQR